ncbi:MAG: FtsX-like permease family protein [Gemmatimonadaceae bacterium]
MIRAPGMNGEQLVPIVRRIATELDLSTPIANPEAMSAVVARSMAKRTFAMLLLAIAAAMALLLSTVGVYGVISAVSQRGNEIGIRMALGATTSTVARLVLRQSLTYVMLGIGAGVDHGARRHARAPLCSTA